MRLFLPGFAALLLTLGAAQAAVTVAPLRAPGELALFGPEATRVLIAAFERAGVNVAPGQAVQVNGRMEALKGERIKLIAAVGGHEVQVEGLLENIDDLVVAWAGKLLTALPSAARGSTAGDKTSATAKHEAGSNAQHSETNKENKVTAVGETKTEKFDAAVSLGKVELGRGEDDINAIFPAPTDRVTPASQPVQPAPVAAAATGSTATLPASPGRWWPTGNQFIGRTVLHTVGLPQGCALGSWATTAAREVLERRLRIQVAGLGACGYLAPVSAMVEASRIGVSSVVMLWFDSLALENTSLGYRAVGQLRIMIVRNGNVVLHRALHPAPRVSASPDLARAAYDLVTEGLNAMSGELRTVLVDSR